MANTHRARKGTKLFPKKANNSRFEAIVAYKRAHEAELKRRAK